MTTLHTVIANALAGVTAPDGTTSDNVADEVTSAVEAYLAQPGVLPEATLEVTDDGSLLPDQARRIEALRAARDVLVTKGSAGPLANRAETPPEVYDLVSLTRFIIDGETPWDDVEQGETDEGDALPQAPQPGVLFVPDDFAAPMQVWVASNWPADGAPPEVRPLSEYRGGGS